LQNFVDSCEDFEVAIYVYQHSWFGDPCSLWSSVVSGGSVGLNHPELISTPPHAVELQREQGS